MNFKQTYEKSSRRCVMRKQVRRGLVTIGIVGLLVFLIQGIYIAEARDPDYPTKPITFYIPWAAGGPLSNGPRPLLEAVGKDLGQPFVIVNKPGGGAILGAMAVMNAKPDGYTLGLFTVTHTLVAPHVDETPYKDLSGFTLISKICDLPLLFIVRGDAPYKTWQEFIEWARKNPKGAKIALPSSRSQSPQGLVMSQIEQKEGVKFTYLAMPGSADSLSALLGGHITAEVMMLGADRVQYINEGKLRVLANTTKAVVPGFESVPFLGNMYDIVAPPAFAGIWGPKNLPAYMVKKLDDGIAKGVKDPAFVALMKRVCLPVAYMNSADLNREVKDLFPKVGQLVKKLRAEELSEKK
jgi:tripartite-type tricarboxylate transporter receptor subunit TctC